MRDSEKPKCMWRPTPHGRVCLEISTSGENEDARCEEHLGLKVGEVPKHKAGQSCIAYYKPSTTQTFQNGDHWICPTCYKAFRFHSGVEKCWETVYDYHSLDLTMVEVRYQEYLYRYRGITDALLKLEGAAIDFQKQIQETPLRGVTIPLDIARRMKLALHRIDHNLNFDELRQALPPEVV